MLLLRNNKKMYFLQVSMKRNTKNNQHNTHTLHKQFKLLSNVGMEDCGMFYAKTTIMNS